MKCNVKFFSLNSMCVDRHKMYFFCLHKMTDSTAGYKGLKDCVSQVSMYWQKQYCELCYGCQPISICHASTLISCSKSPFM